MVTIGGQHLDHGCHQIIGVTEIIEVDGRAIGQFGLAGAHGAGFLGGLGLSFGLLGCAGTGQHGGTDGGGLCWGGIIAREFGRTALAPDLLTDHLGTQQLAEFHHGGRGLFEHDRVQHAVRALGIAGENHEFGQHPACIGITRCCLHRCLGGRYGCRQIACLKSLTCIAHDNLLLLNRLA